MDEPNLSLEETSQLLFEIKKVKESVHGHYLFLLYKMDEILEMIQTGLQ